MGTAGCGDAGAGTPHDRGGGVWAGGDAQAQLASDSSRSPQASAPARCRSTVETARGACSSWSRRVASRIHDGTQVQPILLDVTQLITCCGERGSWASPSIPTSDERPLLRSTTRTRRQHAVARYGVSADPTWRPRLGASSPERHAATLHQPQGRTARVRAGRLPLHRPRRRRERGRPRQPSAEPRYAPREAAPHRRRRRVFPTRFRDQSFRNTQGALPEIWAYGLRKPCGSARSADGRPVHRRRRQSARERVNFQPSTSPGGETTAGAAWKGPSASTHRRVQRRHAHAPHPRLRSLARVLDHRWLPLTAAPFPQFAARSSTAISCSGRIGRHPERPEWSTTRSRYEALDHDVRRGRRPVPEPL